MPQAALPFLAPVAGAAVGGLFGGTHPSTQQAVPQQLGPLNQSSIQGLMTLLGFGGPNPWAPQSQAGGIGAPRLTPGVPFGAAPGGNPANNAASNPWGLAYGRTAAAPGGMTSAGLRSGPASAMPASLPGNLGAFMNGGAAMGQGTTGSPLDQMFGNLGQPLTQLQGQSLGGISQFLNSPAPEQQALGLAQPMLQNLLGNNPGAPVMNVLQPLFERNLAQANQQGGRFGSANALMRSQALNDFNLLGAQAAQQGVNQQLQGANMLGILSSAAGQNPFNRLGQAFGIGQSQAGQNDVGLQRALQIMMQGAFGFPITQSPSGLQQGAQLGGQVGQIMAMLPYFQSQGGGSPAATGALWGETPGTGFGGIGG